MGMQTRRAERLKAIGKYTDEQIETILSICSTLDSIGDDFENALFELVGNEFSDDDEDENEPNPQPISRLSGTVEDWQLKLGTINRQLYKLIFADGLD